MDLTVIHDLIIFELIMAGCLVILLYRYHKIRQLIKKLKAERKKLEEKRTRG